MPAAARDAVARWRDGLRSRSEWAATTPADALRLVESQIATLRDAARQLGISGEGREKFLAGLMRLTAGLVARGAADGKGIDLLVTAGIDPLPTEFGVARASLTIEAPPNWTMEGERTFEFAGLSRGEAKEAHTRLKPLADPQTTVLRAQLAMETAEGRQVVRFEQTLLPSIGRWWIIGPFDAPQAARLQEAFPPEAKIDFDATYAGKGGGPIRWQRVERPLGPEADLADEFFVEFHKVFGRYEQNAVAYGLAYLEAPREMDAVLALGSDDGFALWLNGKEIARKDVGRPYLSREDRVPLHLVKGSNTLLLKISQGGGMWGFGAHLEDESGKPLTDVQVKWTP